MDTEAIMTNKQNEFDKTNTRVLNEPGFGARLKAAREAMRLTEKDVASRLHLSPRIILIMENEDFDHGLPPTFMRGYVRSYARMMNFSENEINAVVVHQETNSVQAAIMATLNNTNTEPTYSSHRYMSWMTYIVTAVLIVLVSMWWVSHPKDSMQTFKFTSPVVTETPKVKTEEPAQLGIAPTPTGTVIAPTENLNTNPGSLTTSPTPATPSTTTVAPPVSAPALIAPQTQTPAPPANTAIPGQPSLPSMTPTNPTTNPMANPTDNVDENASTPNEETETPAPVKHKHKQNTDNYDENTDNENDVY